MDQIELFTSGVWVMNPTTGEAHALAPVGGVMAVRGRYAWVGLVGPRDLSPPHLPQSCQCGLRRPPITLARDTSKVDPVSLAALVVLKTA